MSERPTDPPNEDELEPTSDEVPAAEAAGTEPDTFEDDAPTTEEGDAALLAAAEESPLASIAAIGGVEETVQQTRPMRPSERRAMRAAMEHGQVVADPAHRVSDRPSAVFVIVTVAAFVLILFNGLVLGRGGLLTPIPTPGPIPTATAAPVPTDTSAPSGSAAASSTPVVTPAPTATPAVTAPPPTATPGPT